MCVHDGGQTIMECLMAPDNAGGGGVLLSTSEKLSH